jgi:chromate reductase
VEQPEPSVPPLRRVLCLAGSLRRDSWNCRLLNAAATCAPDGFALALYGALAAIPMFNEDLEEPDPLAVEDLRQAVRTADGLLIATPEYNQSFPGVLKNAIDWLWRGRDTVLAGKPVAVIGATPGNWGTRLAQAALRQVLNATEARVMPAPMLFVARARASFDDRGQLQDAALATALRGVLDAFAQWIVLEGQEYESANSISM